MELTIEVDATQVTDALAGLSRQMQYGMANALNATANDAQRAIQQSLAQKFTLRRGDFIRRTIKRQGGAGADSDFAALGRLVARVRVDPARDILAKFEEGGVKQPTRGGAHIAIPTGNVRRTKSEVIAASARPRPLIAAGRAFIRANAIFARSGRGRAALVRVAYLLARSVRIPKRLGFVATGTAAVDAQWERRAGEAVDRELARLR